MIWLQRQEWQEYTRIIITLDNVASVQLELYDTEQKFGGTVWLYALWVDKTARRQGLARRLLKTAEQVVRNERKHRSIFLDWKEKDTPVEVLHFYQSIGYEERGFSGRGDYVLLEKML